MKSKMIILIVSLAMVLIAGAGYWGWQPTRRAEDATTTQPVTVPVSRGLVQQTVTAPGQVFGTREVWLGPGVAGRLADLKVQPGTVVQAGQELARLDPEPLTTALKEAQLNLAVAQAEQQQHLAEAELALKIAQARHTQALTRLPNRAAVEAALRAEQAHLDELLAGPGQNEITIATAELRRSQANLRLAQQAYDEIAYVADVGRRPEALALEEATLDYEAKQAAYNVAGQGASASEIAQTTAQVEQAQAEVQATQAEIEAQQQELTILDLEIEQARLTLAHWQAGVDPLLSQAVEQARQNLAKASLTAPFGGVVLAVTAKPGEAVTAETGLILLADPTVAEVQVKVIEEDLPLIALGQSAELFFDAQPIEAVPGRVTRLLPQRLPGEDRPLYAVTITPNALPVGVVSGMTADASIIIAQQPGVLRLPRGLVQPNSQGIAVVKVWQDRQIASREVLVGLRGDVYVEIVAGLGEGDEIVGE